MMSISPNFVIIMWVIDTNNTLILGNFSKGGIAFEITYIMHDIYIDGTGLKIGQILVSR